MKPHSVSAFSAFEAVTSESRGTGLSAFGGAPAWMCHTGFDLAQVSKSDADQAPIKPNVRFCVIGDPRQIAAFRRCRIHRVFEVADTASDGAIVIVRRRHTKRDVGFPICDTEIARIGGKFDLQPPVRSEQSRQCRDQNMVSAPAAPRLHALCQPQRCRHSTRSRRAFAQGRCRHPPGRAAHL
jgi:hypothetical protein